MRFNVITIFPDAFPGLLNIGLIGKALKSQIFQLNTIDLKKYSVDGRVDDRPFGGGPGMIIQADILENCFVDNNLQDDVIFFLSPSGRQFDQNMAKLMEKNHNTINLLCGRYEGIDCRLFTKFKIIEISIGDFILCGGEIGAMVVIETIARLLPGVLHNPESLEDESFANNLLEHSHYTRPKIWHSYEIPEILFSGHHLEIKKFHFLESLQKTKKLRLDLFSKYLINYISILIFELCNNPKQTLKLLKKYSLL